MGRREGGKVAGLAPPPRASSPRYVRCQASAEATSMPRRGWAPVGAQGAGGSRCASGGGGSGTEPAAVPRCLRTCGRAGRQPGGAEGTCVGGGCGCAGGGRHAGGLLLCGPGVHVCVLTAHRA